MPATVTELELLADPPLGCISLNDKVIPVCERELESTEPLCVLRAHIDVKPFKDKLLALPAEMWDDDKQEGNVKLVRPAHDAWGIKKIAFTFCDDFLLKVVDLPWSQLDEWKVLLTPIYAAVGITCPEKQVVRSLLASMPPSMDIPVHHDTGFWVKHTHRCHVPIITNEKVDFLVGPTADRMVKVPFREGCLLELNNQAKHAVTNGNARESGFWRVHLIFDYVDLPATVAQETTTATTATTAGTTVDAPVPMSATTGEDGGAVLPSPPCTSAGTSAATAPPVFTRTVLQPGDVVHQTRRSIAVAGAPPAHTGPLLPLFMIIGAQKSGTTSMYDYITQHPLVLKGQRREAHYFDWRYRMDLEDQTLTVAGMKQSVEQHRSHYMSTFYHPGVLKVHTSLITGDSTPSYLLHSDVVIPRLLRMYGAGKTVTTTRIVASAAATTPTSSSSDSGGGTATTSTDSSTTTVAVNTTELEAPLKLLVMMRDPVDRAYSQFQMMRDQQGTAEQMRNRGKSALSPTLSFAEVVDLELEAIEAAGGLDAESSLEHFRTAHLSKISHFTHGGHSLILRGVYYFQLLSWMQYFPLYTGKQHSSGEVSSSSHCGSGSSGSAGSGDPLDRAEILVTTLDEISMDKHAAPTREGAARIQNKMNEVFAFLGLREHGLEDVSIKNKRLYKTEEPSSSSSSGSSSSSVEKKAVDQDKDQDKANKSPSMLPETRAKLVKFYAPLNAKLAWFLRQFYQDDAHPVLQSIRNWQGGEGENVLTSEC